MHAGTISPELLANMLQQFLADVPGAVAVEQGEVLFDFSSARYSISGEGRCVLHMWSEERNAVRRVLAAEVRGRALHLQVSRFGQTRPTVLEISAQRDHRTGAGKRASRTRYQALLERVLRRDYVGLKLEHFSSSPDLEHSLSPVYARGLLRAGQSAFAVLGVNAEESQPSVDAALTFGILWMDYQRRQLAGRAVVEGLKLFVPPVRSAVVRQRAANLNHDAAGWQIYELDERSEICEPIDTGDAGNILSRLTRAVDRQTAEERFAASISRIRSLVPAAEVAVESASEIVFRLHGLEFARARLTPIPDSFRNGESILFGIAPAEFVLDESSEPLFTELVRRISEQRHPGGSHTNLFFRLAPERWLESLIRREVRVLDERLDGRSVYSQVPAFAATDRVMLDVLTCTIDGRLAVLELKANEDIHLPLQGLDYWARVRWHQQHGEFAHNGYFPGRELSSAPPLLYLIAPALHTHPTTDVLLRYLSPRIEWQLLQVDERWRQNVRVVNRKHAAKAGNARF
ncbi:MAG TPA: hypothetical protein VL240_12580 [Candidatus Binatia bacterium]|nr:hypothetical protein [Candidatus Binatia bacterium]